jgi:hypothetical protein
MRRLLSSETIELQTNRLPAEDHRTENKYTAILALRLLQYRFLKVLRKVKALNIHHLVAAFASS